MDPLLSDQFSRTYTIAFAPILLAFLAVGIYRLWKWVKLRTPD